MASAGWQQVNISRSRSSLNRARLRHGMLLGIQAGELGEAFGTVGERAVAAQPVDRAPASRDRDPGARVGRHAVARPGRDGGGERVLHRVLGELEVADVADERGQDLRPLGAEGALDGGGRVPRSRPPLIARAHARACAWPSGDGISLRSMTGRTSIDP